MHTLLEVCADSYASAMAAIRGGADRLELCSGLAVGGLTPSVALLQQIREVSNIPIRCLMRPRGGDFLYTPQEIRQMVMEMEQLRLHGADGFVIGCLTADGDLDAAAMAPLVEAAAGTGLTLHRCIDVSRDPAETYLAAAKLGIDTILTSGAADKCMKGMDTIAKLLQLREQTNGPEVLIAGSISASVIRTFRTQLPLSRAFHTSGKVEVESGMRFRREGVPMGLPGLDEWHIHQTSVESVRQAREALYGSQEQA